MKFYGPEQYQEKVNNIFNKVKSELLDNLKLIRIEHIGASSIVGSVSKGDLDIFVGVDKIDFDSSIKQIKKLGYIEKENTLRTEDICMLVTDKFNHDVAIQLVVNGSEFEDFIEFRNLMKARPELVKELNDLKRSCTGLTEVKYREKKSKWIEEVIDKYLRK